jgi:hypothetical protein
MYKRKETKEKKYLQLKTHDCIAVVVVVVVVVVAAVAAGRKKETIYV